MKRGDKHSKAAIQNRTCPKCGISRIVKNGTSVSKNHGASPRYLCKQCGYGWVENSGSVLARIKIADDEQSVFKTIALVARRMPLNQVEDLLQRKSETICKRLLDCFSDADAWKHVSAVVIEKYGVQRREIERLQELLRRVTKREATFHKLAPKARLKLSAEGKSFIRFWRDPALQKELVDGSTHVWKLDEIERHEAFVRRLEQGCLPSGLYDLPSGFAMDRKALREWVEQVLETSLVITTCGVMIRPDVDITLLSWVRTIQGASAQVLAVAQPAFTQVEALIFDQLVKRDAHAQCLAEMERVEKSLLGEKATKTTITFAHLVRAFYGDEMLRGKSGESLIEGYANALKSLSSWVEHVGKRLNRHSKSGNGTVKDNP